MTGTEEAMRVIQRKVATALGEVAFQLAEDYHADVTLVEETPVIGPNGVESFPGPHSKPGRVEFPYKETGRGADSVSWRLDFEKLEARAGVTADGFHLVQLSYDAEGNPKSEGRLGILDTFERNFAAYQSVLSDVIKSTN